MSRSLHTVTQRLVLAFALVAATRIAGEQQYAIPAPLAVRSLLLDGATAGERLIVVGERGHILVSADGGASWEQAVVPTRATLTAVAFADAEQGCAVGHDETIVCTRDGGRTWALAHAAPHQERPLLSVSFLDRQRGFAVGAYGAFLQTEDGGESWNERQIDEADLHLNHLSRAASGELYLAAEAGTLYRSDDDGDSWQELPSPYAGSFFGILPLAGHTLLAFGLRGNLFRSEDAGQTWERIATGAEGLLGHGTVLADGMVVVSGLGGVVLLSNDGGRSFVLHQLANRRGVAAVLQADDGSLVRVGEGGVEPLRLGDAENSRASELDMLDENRGES